ncbi:hypothetical protein F5883DRAFT_557940 [Diaporthe sp. PMI_573]|nr:hypothetical protein F5883DRAFT_557940 [Diaporthaceae sp. PMI_573]
MRTAWTSSTCARQFSHAAIGTSKVVGWVPKYRDLFQSAAPLRANPMIADSVVHTSLRGALLHWKFFSNQTDNKPGTQRAFRPHPDTQCARICSTAAERNGIPPFQHLGSIQSVGRSFISNHLLPAAWFSTALSSCPELSTCIQHRTTLLLRRRRCPGTDSGMPILTLIGTEINISADGGGSCTAQCVPSTNYVHGNCREWM